MWIRQAFLALLGLCSGTAVAGGFFALIIALGLISRFAYKTHTAGHLMLYEDAVAVGGIFGTAWYLYRWPLPIGAVGLGIYGLFAGIFVGAWAMALTEILDTIPIFMRRIRLKWGLTVIIWAMALGRTVGALLHSFVLS